MRSKGMPKPRKEPKRRNPHVEAAIAKKGGPMKDRRLKRAKDKLRRLMEEQVL